jgi:CheY-like chemotaxis protein
LATSKGIGPTRTPPPPNLQAKGVFRCGREPFVFDWSRDPDAIYFGGLVGEGGSMLVFKARRKLLLVVEDDVLLVRPIERAASELGINVLHASTGAQGIRLATERQPDLVLLDLGLPDMDGARVLGSLKSMPQTVSIPVIIYSGRTGHEQRIESFRFGADDYIEKPFDCDMLMRRVEHHMFKTSENTRETRESGVVVLGSFEQPTPVRWIK